MATELALVVGSVKSTNSRGLKIAEYPDWLDYSKFARPEDLDQVNPGQRARIWLDRANYIRRVEVLPGAEANGGAPAPSAAKNAAAQALAARAVDRERTIARMAVLNTATNILSSGGRQAEPVEVLRLAAELEEWVHRPL